MSDMEPTYTAMGGNSDQLSVSFSGTRSFRAARLMPDSLAVAGFAIIAVMLPFEAIGVYVSGYLVTPSTIVGIVMSLYLAVFGHHRKWPILFLFAFGTWCVVTAATRYSASSYLVSLAALIAMAFPVVSAAPYRIRSDRVLLAFRVGFCLVCGMVLAELLTQLIFPRGLEALQDLLLPHARTHDFLGFTRVKGLMLEPAHLALYMCFAYVIFDLLRDNGDGLRWEQLAAVLTIILTLSLSGIMILLSYVAVKWLKSIALAVFKARIRTRVGTWRFVFFTIALGAVIGINWDVLSSITSLFAQRAFSIFTVLMSADYVGSIGSRVNALPVMIDYWIDNWPWGTMAGLGYANFEQWLIHSFGYLGEMSSFARGEVNSIIVVVGLSTGLVGLILFSFLMCSALRKPLRGLGLQMIVFLIMVQLVYGYLVSYFFWHCVLILIIVAIHQQRHNEKNLAH